MLQKIRRLATGAFGAFFVALAIALTSAPARAQFPGTSPTQPDSGGTGQSSLNANAILLGAGTSPVTFLAPGTSGNCAVSNGTVWNSAACVASGSVVGTAPITSSISAGVATIGINLDSNFTVVSNNLAFASIAAGSLHANATAGSAEPTATTLTALIDRALGSTRGSILERGASVWAPITPGTTAFPFVSNGAGADPAYQQLTGAGIASNTVDNPQLRQGVARSVIGVTGNATANVADIQGTASQFFGVNAAGTVLAFQTLGGDATLSGATLTIGAAAVSYSKIQNVNSLSVFGRSTNSSGVGADITGTVSQFFGVNAAGTVLGFQTMAGDATLSGPTITLTANIVSNAKFRQGAGLSLVGVTGSATANVADIVGTANQIPIVNNGGTALAFTTVSGDITNATGVFTIANGAVTNAKRANMAAVTLSGNPTNGSAAPTDFTIQGLTDITTPNTTLDFLLIYDHTAGTIKKTTASELVSAVGGGVTSLTPGNGLTSTLTATAPGSAITTTGTLSSAQLVNAQSGTSYAVLDGDRAKLITASNAAAQAYTIAQAGAASAFQSGWYVDLQNQSTNTAGVVTITPTTSTINGASTLKVYPGQSVRIVSDGTNYQVIFHSTNGAWIAYTPTPSCGSGTFTSASATGRYKVIGDKTVIVEALLTVTTNGSCAVSMRVSTPITAAGNNYSMAGFDSSSAAGVATLISSSDGTTIRMFTAAGAYPTGYNPVVTGVYEIP